MAGVVPTDVFDWIDWQSVRRMAGRRWWRCTAGRGSAPASVNRRAAAVRAFFEYQVLSGARDDNPVPAPRRGQGLRPKARGVLGHLGPGRARQGGRLVRQQRRLPESLDRPTCRRVPRRSGHPPGPGDRAVDGVRRVACRRGPIAPLGRCRSGSPPGAGGRQGRPGTHVPVDGAFFSELAAYLRLERPPGAEDTGVLRGAARPDRGPGDDGGGDAQRVPLSPDDAGATRVRPHRLRHTYGSELAAAGIDLLVLRELMGHASPETTAGYVHLSTDTSPPSTRPPAPGGDRSDDRRRCTLGHRR